MISVTVTKNKISQLSAELQQRIAAGMELTGFGVEREWKGHARVDTGRYKSSIGHWSDHIVKEGNPGKTSDPVWILYTTGADVQLYVGTNVEYAGWLERRYPSQGGKAAIDKTEGLLMASLRMTMGEAFKIL